MSAGHPELVAAIASEVIASGPIPFARFMELALYHPELGYYMRSSKPAAERIGRKGDFYTSSDVHPILGQALAKQAEQMDRLLGQPSPFSIVEMGPGKGLLARHILSTSQRDYPSLFHRLRYVLIERSPAMREAQRINLAPWLERPDLIHWVDDLAQIPPHNLTGLCLSNELVDSFPVHRIQMTARGLEELWVDYRNGRFVECLKPLSSDRIASHLGHIGSNWPKGYRTEVNLHAVDWMTQVAQRLHRGFVLTIDYGHTAQDLYSADRKRGTFLCYHQHAVHEDPFLHVGEQDMTAHVDFSSLATAGEEQGLQTTGFTNQMSFLMGLGIEQMLTGLSQDSPELTAAIQLLKPNGMGTTFKVLIQHKTVPNPKLDGLQYQPFFRSALTTQSAA
ncbi:MAG: SAM-dependent methyltransferase [Nitrospira sp.]|nr:SAM-dependent methyltransferase [Nitrospira sp.]